jgi:hypothetical protein
MKWQATKYNLWCGAENPKLSIYTGKTCVITKTTRKVTCKFVTVICEEEVCEM